MKIKVAIITAVLAAAAVGVASHHGKGGCPLKNAVNAIHK